MHELTLPEFEIAERAPAMERETFDRFRALLRDSVGIALADHKDVLLSTRIGKRMRALGIEEHDHYLDHVLSDGTGAEMVHLVDSVCTNVTSFFRESEHFDRAAELFDTWIAEGRARLRYWSAACATGEEPYTLAMTLRARQWRHDTDVRILATDISTTALATAREGVYRADKARAIPHGTARTFLRSAGPDLIRIDPALGELISFARLNLAAPPFPMQGPFDLIMCRNVMIYFDNQTRMGLIGEIERLLRPGGVVMLGHAESLTGLETGLKLVAPSVYMKR